MLPLHILPVGEKLRDNARNMEKEEERYHVIKRQNPDCDDVQAAVQEVCMRTARSLLALDIVKRYQYWYWYHFK